MSKEEIKALINEKIAGQGNQVDVGNALPTILNEIVDAMGTGGSGAVVIEMGYDIPGSTFEWTEAAEQACIEAFNAGNFNVILKGVPSLPNFIVVTPASFTLTPVEGGRTLTVVWYNPSIPAQSAKQTHVIALS